MRREGKRDTDVNSWSYRYNDAGRGTRSQNTGVHGAGAHWTTVEVFSAASLRCSMSALFHNILRRSDTGVNLRSIPDKKLSARTSCQW